ncbi:carbonic anhydrase [Actinocatenispora rupis]|uniref:carbonic anhydrase n=1 Tax=Actinocatenispora rupis TaxID=519421 RepID=UPI0019455F7A|nr:carbonic anhydrase [Actinocatenispora rupis]
MPPHPPTDEVAADRAVTPPAALRKLIAGNRRFLAGRTDGGRPGGRRTLPAPEPFALVVTCLDGGLAAESLFDAGYGDLCVVRSAGHVLDRGATASVELAVATLGVALVMVLGHEHCAAVRYAVDTDAPTGDLAYLVDEVRPAVAAADRAVDGGHHRHERGTDRYDRVMRHHVAGTVARVGALPAVREGLDAGTLWLVGARHDRTHGRVRLIA